jgi:tetratricopeptide (TPR) repeat protein
MAQPRARAAATAVLAEALEGADAVTLANFAWFAARGGDLATAQAAVRRAVARPDAPASVGAALEALVAGRSDQLILVDPGEAPATGPTPTAASPLAAGQQAHQQASFAVAEACYRAALHLPDSAAEAWNGLAVLHEQREERWAADEAWGRALAASPPPASALHNRALAWIRRGDSARARAFLATHRAVHPPDPSLLTLAALAAMAEQDHAAAAPLLREALALDPELARAQFTLGLIYERLGQHAEALDATRRGLLLSPWYVPQVWLLGASDARARIELPASTASRDAGVATDDVLLALGRSLLETGHLGEALAVFDQVLLRHVSHTAALFHRGVVLAKLRRYAEALEDWERVGHTDPDGPLGAMSRRHAQGARQLAALFGRG